MNNKVYLAGPEVFYCYTKAKRIEQAKKEILSEYGFEGLSPFDKEIDPNTEDLPKTIYKNNISIMNECDWLIANLSPFRSNTADTGTVFELGYMKAQGKKCYGYTLDFDDYFNRIKSAFDLHESYDDNMKAKIFRDENLMLVEDFGYNDNLMVDNALEAFGKPSYNRSDIGEFSVGIFTSIVFEMNRARGEKWK